MNRARAARHLPAWAYWAWAVVLAVGALALPSVLPKTGAHVAYTYYFVDATAGDDANVGTSKGQPWKTLAKVNATPYAPATKVLLKRGETWSGNLTLTSSGSDDLHPIVVSAYGDKADPLPKLTGCTVKLQGDFLTLRRMQLNACTFSGVDVYGDHAVVDQALITHNVTGVFTRPGASFARIADNVIADNNRLSPNTPGPNDDSGAFGVLLQGDDGVIENNIISGSDTASPDYGRDGSAVEVYGGQRNLVTRNTAVNNVAFTELGNPRSADNTFAYNLVTSSSELARGLVVPGGGSSFGPVTGTAFLNNTVVLTSATSQGFVCHSGCGPTILRSVNNIIGAVQKTGYADAPFDGHHNLYLPGGQTQFSLAGSDLVVDPQFVGNGDLHLRPDSPARDSGVDVGLAKDRDGRSVPQGGAVDRGPFEFPTLVGTTTTTAGPPASTTTTSGPPPTTTTTPPSTTTTTTPDPGALKVAAVGDIQPAGTSANSNATAARAANADIILGLGDYQYSNGDMAAYNAYFDLSWGPLVPKMYPVLAPNHDQYWQAGETMNYWNGGGAHGYRSPVTLSPLTPYSFDRGGWHFIALPDACGRVSGCSISAITSWLTADLAANPVACTVAYWHQAMFTSTTTGHGQENSVKPWVDALVAAHADVLLQGHNHDYERFALQDGNRNPTPSGIQAFVVGTGGIGSYSFTDTAPNSVARSDTVFGVLELTLRAGSYDWNFARTGGSSFSDSGSMACR